MFYIGLDLGQRRDYSAVAVVERIELRRAYLAPEFHSVHVRYVERMPLGMPYPAVVERMRELVQDQALRGNCALAVDATGVGAPVVDMLRAARLGCDLMAVTITGGDKPGESGSQTCSVPKRDLMAGVQLLLEKRQLKIGALREASRLARELAGVRISMRAEGAGQHDDLVIALALACWRAKCFKLNSWCGEGRLV